MKPWTIVHGFWLENKNFEFGKKGYHLKGYLKRNILALISTSYLLPLRSYESRKFCTPVCLTPITMCVSVLVQLYFYPTVQQIYRIIGVDITPSSGCFSLVLCLWSFFDFGVESVFASRFVSPCKYTVNTTLQQLIPPHWKVLCD